MKNSSNHIIVHSPHGSHPGGKISLNSDSLDTGLHGLQGSDPGPMDSPKGSRHAMKSATKLFSECRFVALNFPITNEKIWQISALEFEKGSNYNKKALYNVFDTSNNPHNHL